MLIESSTDLARLQIRSPTIGEMLLPSMFKGRVDEHHGRNMYRALMLTHLCQRHGTEYARCRAGTINIPLGCPTKTVHQIHILLQKFSQHFEQVSSNDSYPPEFSRIKPTLEAVHLDFAPTEDLYYNSPITIRELDGALKQCQNTAPGEDGVRY